MKKLFVSMGLALSLTAQAAPESSVLAGLNQSLLAHRAASTGTSLLRVEGGDAVQGSEYNAFIRTVSQYNGSYVVIDANLDGASVTLEHPTQDLWIFHSAEFEKLTKHVLSLTVSLENATQADQISKSLTQVENEILSLQTEIQNTTDQNQLLQLQNLLNQKLALQSQLTADLANLKNPIGTDTYMFSVAAAPANTGSFPTVTAVSPDVGTASGGASVTITGTNFTSGAVVSFGGVSATSTTFVSATSLVATAPAFQADGVKDVVVTLPLASGDVEQKQALLKNAYFATSVPVNGVSNVPVALAGGVQTITLGASTTLNGSQSTGPGGDTLTYAWSLIAKPFGSNLPTGTTIATVAGPSVTPDYPGRFVYQLVITDTNTGIVSAPSLTIVTATLPSATLTATAPAITTITGGYATSQVTVSDTNSPYLHFNYYLTQPPLFGNATVSSSGLVAYQETATGGQAVDELGVTVVDSEHPSNSYTVLIPITINTSVTPPSAIEACAIQNNTLPVLVGCSTFNPSAPDGSIATTSWNFGDATPYEFTPPTNLIPIYGIEHNYYSYGTYFIGMTTFDNLGSSTNYGENFVVQPDTIPVSNFTLSAVSGAAPFTVTLNATGSHAVSGSLSGGIWSWGDGSYDFNFGLTPTHTYQSAGTYNIQEWLFDANGGMSVGTATVYVSTTPPSTGTPPSDYVNVTTPREQTVGTNFTFDGSTYSFDANPSGSVAGYAWNFGDYVSCTNGCTAATASSSHTYTQPTNAFVELTVTNALGGSSPAYMEIMNVTRGHAPRSIFNLNASSGVAPLSVSANGSSYSYDPDGQSLTYSWNWGDGSANSTGGNATHVFTTPGTYIVSLSVTDPDGNINTSSQIVSATSSYTLESTKPHGGGGARTASGMIGACAAGNGRACDAIAKIYAQKGDSFTSKNLKKRACKLGFNPSCSN